MSIPYTPQEKLQRTPILQSHVLFGKFLQRDIVNTLLNLFLPIAPSIRTIPANNVNIGNVTVKFNRSFKNHPLSLHHHSVIDCLTEERKKMHLDTSSNVIIEAKRIGMYNKNIPTSQGRLYNSGIILKILKNNKDFIHLSLHFVVKDLAPNKQGIVHLVKNTIKKKSGKHIQPPYALLEISPSIKPNSLTFHIAYGKNTLGVPVGSVKDKEMKDEMEAVVRMLNRLFDKDDPYYVGKINNVQLIHLNTNTVLNNMNRETTHVRRANHGSYYFPESSVPFHQPPLTIGPHLPHLPISFRKKRFTRPTTRTTIKKGTPFKIVPNPK